MSLVEAFRGGHLTEIPIDELVVGERVLLQLGDRVPADGLLLAGHAEVDEAALTGESEPVAKTALALGTEADIPEQGRLWRGGLVVDGGG